MTENDPCTDNVPNMQPTPTPLDSVLAFIKREKPIRKASGCGARPEAGIRFEVDPADGSGYSLMHRFGNGLEVVHSDQLRTTPLKFSLKNVHTHFGFSLILEGHIFMDVPELGKKARIGQGEITFRSGSVAQVEQVFPAGTRVRGLAMDLPYDMLNAWRAEAPESLDRSIRALLHHTPPPFMHIFPADEAVVAQAEKMLDMNTATVFGRMQYEAAALNLLACIIDPGSPPVVHLTRSQMRQIYLQQALDQAVDILRLEWSSPPTIDTLAHRIGLNERTLRDEFRKRTGHTIGEFERKQRMERARVLIETQGFGVHEAALQVGYSNPSHFSKAFRKYFGHLPSERRGHF